jgi:hypothetical protein
VSGDSLSLIGRDEHRIVVLQCDECGEPRAGCRAVDCALSSRPYAGEDVVPADQLRGAVEDRDALSVMLKRLLDVALVDGYGETVRDEAEALLTRVGGQ